ncbi:MAG TPA: hypothetical protein VGJ57_03335 [Nitrospirales bacterium]
MSERLSSAAEKHFKYETGSLEAAVPIVLDIQRRHHLYQSRKLGQLALAIIDY